MDRNEIVDIFNLNEVLNKIIKESNFLRKHFAYKLYADKYDYLLPLKGIGLSCAFEGSGYYGASVNENNLCMEVSMEVDGTVCIKSQTPSSSILEIWKNIVCEILEVEKSIENE